MSVPRAGIVSLVGGRNHRLTKHGTPRQSGTRKSHPKLYPSAHTELAKGVDDTTKSEQQGSSSVPHILTISEPCSPALSTTVFPHLSFGPLSRLVRGWVGK